MGASERRVSLRKALRMWGERRRALEEDRDPLVLASLRARIAKEEIHQATGLGRSTIDRIEKASEQGEGNG